jgi:hypothetical protein
MLLPAPVHRMIEEGMNLSSFNTLMRKEARLIFMAGYYLIHGRKLTGQNLTII